MQRTKQFFLGTAAAIGLAALMATPTVGHAQAPAAVAIDGDDIGGVVRGPNGPEAGVWVIAETRDLPTRFTRSVVTDDQGRYVLPDLPKAKYKIWVRGYGLVDSPKVDGEPGQQLNLTAVPAPNEAAAAQYYPAIYWYSMLKIPAADQFGGKSDIPSEVTQPFWLATMKNNQCVGCHQLGGLATRTIPTGFGEFKNSEEAWMRRTQSGQAGEMMTNVLAGQLGGAPYKYFANWTDRIAKGELPHAKPQRPSGVERNVVVSTWDWSDEKHYLHDLISTDKRNSTVNGYGKIYGQPEYSTDNLPVLDPEDQHGHDLQGAGARSGDAGVARPRPCRRREADHAFRLLGQRATVGYPGQQPQLGVRQEGQAVARSLDPRPGNSGVLPRWLGSSVSQAAAARAQQPTGRDV